MGGRVDVELYKSSNRDNDCIGYQLRAYYSGGLSFTNEIDELGVLVVVGMIKQMYSLCTWLINCTT